MKNTPKSDQQTPATQARIWPEIPDLYETAGSITQPSGAGEGAAPDKPTSDPRQRPLPGFTPA